MNIVFWNDFMAKDANLPFHYCDNDEFLSSNLSKVLQSSPPPRIATAPFFWRLFLESEKKMCVSSPSCDILPNCNPFRGVGEGVKPSPVTMWPETTPVEWKVFQQKCSFEVDLTEV